MHAKTNPLRWPIESSVATTAENWSTKPLQIIIGPHLVNTLNIDRYSVSQVFRNI